MYNNILYIFNINIQIKNKYANTPKYSDINVNRQGYTFVISLGWGGSNFKVTLFSKIPT